MSKKATSTGLMVWVPGFPMFVWGDIAVTGVNMWKRGGGLDAF